MASEIEPPREPDPTPLSPQLPERDARILQFERRQWPHAGAKEAAIRAQFDLAPARYYQILNAALNDPAAILFDPMLVRRLQRLLDTRIGARAARLIGTPDRTHKHPTQRKI